MTQRRRPSMFAIVIGVMVVLGIVAIALTRQSEESGTDPSTAEVAVDGEPLPTFRNQPEDAAVGRTVPELNGVDLAGAPLAITDDGRPKAIAFLAHWCPHCQREVTEMVAWLEANELPAGVDVYAVSTLVDRTRGNYPPRDWLDAEGWPFPTLVDDASNSAANAYGLAGTPFWVFVDAGGTVAVRLSGAIGAEVLTSVLTDLSR